MEYPKYIVRKRDKAIWIRYQDTNLYQREFIPEIPNREPPKDWWTYELLTENFDFFPIDNEEHTMYTKLNEQFCAALDRKCKSSGCGDDE